ncbi:ras family-domain-containing protein [Anaeramoeba flamelloides]|uniref:Ras family-domain-containing protein n=1 Tax=Anaeramoeba flamelloides TaxID=1746091 RepID=A0ABQ8YE82_9EUKA|nr:ras family-domain-containing protein [Anaeramoeba flamelloides]
MSQLKIVLLGESGVGKTCLVQKLVYDRFNSQEPSTMGASFLKKKYKNSKGKYYDLAIWDTAGQERFDSLATFYTRDAGCAIIVYDISARVSFEDLDRFVKKLEYADKKCFIVLIGSKLDIIKADPKKRKVSTEEGKQYATNINAIFFESSSKTGENIEEIWNAIGSKYETIQTEKQFLRQKLNEERNKKWLREQQTLKNSEENNMKIDINKKKKKKNNNSDGGCC